MKPIAKHLRPILGAESVSVGVAGIVSLRGPGGVQANVARVDNGALKFHPDMSGNERSPEWKAALERALVLPEGWDQ